MADRRAPRVVQVVVGSLVGALLLGLVAVRLDWSEVGGVLRSSDPRMLLPISAVLLIHYAVKGLRWRAILAARTPVKGSLAIRLTLVGFLFNSVIPARVGELGRPYLLSRNSPDAPLPFAIATVLADKLFDLAAVLVCLLLVLGLRDLPPTIERGVLLLALAIGLGIGLAVVATWWRGSRRSIPGPRPMREAVASFADGLATVSSVRVTAAASAHTAIAFALLLVSSALTMAMVGLPIDWVACLLVLGAVGVGFLLPSPPAHAGTYHFFASQALVVAGAAEAEAAFAFALVAHTSQLAVVALAGLASLVGLDWSRAQR